MIKDFISMLNYFPKNVGPGSLPDPNIYYRTDFSLVTGNTHGMIILDLGSNLTESTQM